ncbi:MAG: HD domain-containing phosphohydrolase [Anaerolineaceae bacterium]
MFRSRSDSRNQELNESLVRLAYIAEIKEWDNRLHLERIRGYCQILAQAAGLTGQEAFLLGLASQLHDIGKVEVPDELLKRTGNYNADEWQLLEKHTLNGAKILDHSSSAVLQTASAIALTHHERWDGSGYPRGLKGEEIPISGRICAIADVFDALTTHRSYKELISDESAFEMIQQSSGTLFDPALVAYFTAKFSEILAVKNSIGW